MLGKSIILAAVAVILGLSPAAAQQPVAIDGYTPTIEPEVGGVGAWRTSGKCQWMQIGPKGMVFVTCRGLITDTGTFPPSTLKISLPVPASGINGSVSGRMLGNRRAIAGNAGTPDAGHALVTYADGSGFSGASEFTLSMTYQAAE